MIGTAQETLEAPPSAEAITFTEARQRHQALVFAFVARRVRPVEEAEDVTAAVFVDAYRFWSRRRAESRLWLLGIARRKVADHLRRQRNAWQVREEDLQADAMESFVQRAEVVRIAALVGRLPAEERDALLLQVLEEMTIEEIAVVIGRSVKATNSLLGRARARLRRLAGEGDR